MIIMKKDATDKEVQNVIDEIKKYGLRADVSRGEYRTIIGLVGDESHASFAHLSVLPGVKEARMVEAPYKLINREYSSAFEEEEGTLILDPAVAGEGTFLLRVRGESMTGDHILPGDLILVKKQDRALEGELVIVPGTNFNSKETVI